jgi:penicillin-binding protein 1A
LLRLIGYAFSIFTFAAIMAGSTIMLGIAIIEPDLPDYTTLADYAPPVKSRLYAATGEALADFA